MTEHDRLYLTHIQERIGRIEDYTRQGYSNFAHSPMVQDAVIRNFEIIGEAVKQISEETLEKVPEIPWRRITGFRDVLIHDYMGVDLEEIWNVIAGHLPKLKAVVDDLLT